MGTPLAFHEKKIWRALLEWGAVSVLLQEQAPLWPPALFRPQKPRFILTLLLSLSGGFPSLLSLKVAWC